ncbi:MAG: hypothetical protein IKN63_06425 [Bacilli bacterium]|nr:hypothetical protein [Bacilli bacterium]
MGKKKVKLKKKNTFLFILVVLLFIGACIYIFQSKDKFTNTFFESKKEGFIASNQSKLMVQELTINEETKEESLIDGKEFVRGTKINYLDSKKKIIGENEYTLFDYEDKTYYILSTNVVDKISNVVLEKELYVRTSFNLLKDFDGNLGTLLKKGEQVEIVGYNELEEDGTVDLYKVKKGEEEGFYYSDFLVLTEEDAKKNYDEDGIYKIHVARTNKYGGGNGGTLDYYPVVKPTFEDNKMPDEVYALYINGSKGIRNSVDNYIEYAKTTKINAFVVDIKDDQVPAYASKIYETYSPTNFKYAYNSVDDYKYAIDRLKEEGFYVIGRITTFKDDYYALDNPNNVIKKTDGNLLKHNGSYWPTAFNRDVWKFNVDLAKEAINLFGFNEIQFDYCRFPDRLNTYEKAGTIDYSNIHGEEKAEAIQKFLIYATRELHKLKVYVSADVFGESSWGYVTGYGQYWPAMSNVVDAISAMPYTDHFTKDETYWKNPYQTMLNWGKTAAERQKEIPTPATPRTWITAYDTPYWNPTVTYNGEMLEKQIQGLYDAGLTGGYMTWNSGSNLAKYKSQASAFKKTYSSKN